MNSLKCGTNFHYKCDKIKPDKYQLKITFQLFLQNSETVLRSFTQYGIAILDLLLVFESAMLTSL